MMITLVIGDMIIRYLCTFYFAIAKAIILLNLFSFIKVYNNADRSRLMLRGLCSEDCSELAKVALESFCK